MFSILLGLAGLQATGLPAGPELYCRVVALSGEVATFRLDLDRNKGAKLSPLGEDRPLTGRLAYSEGNTLPFEVDDGIHAYSVQLLPPSVDDGLQDITLSEQGLGLPLASGFCGTKGLTPSARFHQALALPSNDREDCVAMASDGRTTLVSYKASQANSAIIPQNKNVWPDRQFDFQRTIVPTPAGTGDLQSNLAFLERNEKQAGPWGGSEDLNYSVVRKRGVQVLNFSRAGGAFGNQPMTALCTPAVSNDGLNQ